MRVGGHQHIVELSVPLFVFGGCLIMMTVAVHAAVIGP